MSLGYSVPRFLKFKNHLALPTNFFECCSTLQLDLLLRSPLSLYQPNQLNMKKLLILSSLLAVCSCATVFNGGSQSVIANASGDVENVAVEIKTPNGAYRSKLPTTLVTSPSSFNNTTITVKDKCYEETQLQVGKSITPSFWANILWVYFAPVGMIIDFVDGSMWKIDTQTIVPVSRRDVCKK